MSEPRRDRAAARQVSRPISREAVTDEVSLFVLRKRRTHCPQSHPCHCEPVRTLVWQSVLPFRLPLQLEPADAGLRVGETGATDETRSIPLPPLPPSAACGARGRGTAQRGKESMSSAVPAVYSGRLIAAPTVSRLTILRATARLAPTEERDVEDAVPYGITSAGRRGRRPLRSHDSAGDREGRPYVLS